MKRMSLLLLLLAPLCAPVHAEDQQFARIGDLKLENGEVIHDCVVGYRTFGAENPQKTNVVVFPTYLGGRSADLASRIGAGKMVDSAKYYVIAVDSLADGISSSPTNSSTQPRMQFPQISIRDMVNAEYKMLTDSLHLTHVLAVMGFSMGGMQAFQWAVPYPEFMDKIVSIVGSPATYIVGHAPVAHRTACGRSRSGLEKWAVHESTEATSARQRARPRPYHA